MRCWQVAASFRLDAPELDDLRAAANGEVGSVCVEPSDATISAATLIADGTADRLDPVPSEYDLAQLIRGVRLKLYPNAGHAFLFQDEKAFVPLIESFLH
jgi:pimeloyl-ACP methyl ester carboxylesterase